MDGEHDELTRVTAALLSPDLKRQFGSGLSAPPFAVNISGLTAKAPWSERPCPLSAEPVCAAAAERNRLVRSAAIRDWSQVAESPALAWVLTDALIGFQTNRLAVMPNDDLPLPCGSVSVVAAARAYQAVCLVCAAWEPANSAQLSSVAAGDDGGVPPAMEQAYPGDVVLARLLVGGLSTWQTWMHAELRLAEATILRCSEQKLDVRGRHRRPTAAEQAELDRWQAHEQRIAAALKRLESLLTLWRAFSPLDQWQTPAEAQAALAEAQAALAEVIRAPRAEGLRCWLAREAAERPTSAGTARLLDAVALNPAAPDDADVRAAEFLALFFRQFALSSPPLEQEPGGLARQIDGHRQAYRAVLERWAKLCEFADQTKPDTAAKMAFHDEMHGLGEQLPRPETWRKAALGTLRDKLNVALELARIEEEARTAAVDSHQVPAHNGANDLLALDADDTA